MDSDYKYILPLYNYIFNYKNISLEKNFFFFKKKYITASNWLYSYNCFLTKHDIKAICILNHYEYKKFFNIFLKLNLPILSFLTEKTNSDFIDYYFFINKYEIQITKIFLCNYISSVYFSNFNLKSILLKKQYFFFLKKLAGKLVINKLFSTIAN